jgi:hypothetical protein
VDTLSAMRPTGDGDFLRGEQQGTSQMGQRSRPHQIPLQGGTAICRQALLDFKALLTRLAGDPANLFTMIDTQGVLAPADWANELHPYPAGFRNLAGKFVDALRAAFPGRI